MGEVKTFEMFDKEGNSVTVDEASCESWIEQGYSFDNPADSGSGNQELGENGEADEPTQESADEEDSEPEAEADEGSD